MKNILQSLIDDYGNEKVVTAAKQLLDQEQNKRAGQYHDLVTPDKILEVFQLLEASTKDIAEAGYAVDVAYANRRDLVKEITKLETSIELDEAEAFMKIDGNKVQIDGSTVTLSNDKMRSAYQKYVTKDHRVVLGDLEAELKAIEIDIYKAKERQDEAKQSASVIKARAHVQSSLLQFLV